MEYIYSSSTMWRATCSFSMYQSNIYLDYVRAQISEVDILSFNGLECRRVDYINIRGHSGLNITVGFFQTNTYIFSIHSLSIPCDFEPGGSNDTADFFGHYGRISKAFRCTKYTESTTQYWFGVNV